MSPGVHNSNTSQLGRRAIPPRWVLSSLRGYRRSWATADALAALTLLVIAVPEQLATSRLAGMPPITGFYAFAAGTVLFALLGSNPQMSVGADSTIAPLFAVGLAHLAPGGSGRYVELAGILSVEIGAIVALVWLLRLGWIAGLLSAPIIAGFLAGVAVIIVVHQLPDLLGVPASGGSTIHRLQSTFSELGAVNGWTLVIGLGVLAIVAVAPRVQRRLPGALIGLALATLAVSELGLRRHGVAVLGPIAGGTPHLGLVGLSVSVLGRLAPLAGVVSLVVVSQSAATTRAFADEGGYEVDVGRDLLGVGAGNAVSGLIGAFPVDASPPRTAAVASSGGRTQLTGLLAAAAILALIPAAGLLKDVPLAALSGVLVFVATRIFHTGELIEIARFDRFELGLAIVTLLAVALIGVEQGIGVAVGLAILDRTRLSARPQLHVLGRIPGTTSWAPLSAAGHAVQLPGVLVVQFATPLWYGNAVRFRAELDAARRRAIGQPRIVVLDALGMTDLDYTGFRSLREALDVLDRDHVGFAVARAGTHLRDNLARCGLLERIGSERFFDSVDAAVSALGAPAPGAAATAVDQPAPGAGAGAGAGA
ncbi:MAG: SulP family inorganic anion transporter [Solirubrobacteraceae bacterium]